MQYSRRDLSVLLPALFAAQAAVAQNEQLPSKCYDFNSLPVRKNSKTGNVSRQVFTGETHEGTPIDLHITTLQPGQMPHPPHRHVHEELMLIQTGTLEFMISGQNSRIGPGSVAFIHSGDLHGLKNVGTEPAQYFVLAIGHQKKA